MTCYIFMLYISLISHKRNKQFVLGAKYDSHSTIMYIKKPEFNSVFATKSRSVHIYDQTNRR